MHIQSIVYYTNNTNSQVYIYWQIILSVSWDGPWYGGIVELSTNYATAAHLNATSMILMSSLICSIIGQFSPDFNIEVQEIVSVSEAFSQQSFTMLCVTTLPMKTSFSLWLLRRKSANFISPASAF